jgi:hypothetical protein
MKKLAFFIAVLVGLNATSVVRRPEEEEGQAIVQHESHPSSLQRYASVIQLLTDRFNQYLFAITREGLFVRISWEKIAGILNRQQKQSKLTRIVYQMQCNRDNKSTDILIF